MLETLLNRLTPQNVQLVAVSKTHPPEHIQPLYQQGQRDFGENRVQELVSKYEALPKDIRWHLIGHLQRNKVKYIASFIHTIHSVDSLDLLLEINRYAAQHGRVIDCLLQFHIATEESKFGLTLDQADALLQDPARLSLEHVRICGVMGMATFTDDTTLVRAEFRQLKSIFEHLQKRYFYGEPDFTQCSMGMSGDWQIAVEEGSTMVRIGSLLFGQQ